MIELSEQIKSKANVDRWKNSIIEHELILFLGSEAEYISVYQCTELIESASLAFHRRFVNLISFKYI